MTDRKLRNALKEAGMLYECERTYCTTFGYGIEKVLQGVKQAIPLGPDFAYVQKQVRQLQDRVDLLAHALGFEYEYTAAAPAKGAYKKKARKK
jgi:hypothetical protein